MISFADDTRLYYGISNVDDCAILQNDLNIYEWASGNNMFFNAQKFQYLFIDIIHIAIYGIHVTKQVTLKIQL